MGAKVEAAIGSPNGYRSAGEHPQECVVPVRTARRVGDRFAIPHFEESTERLFWQERHSASLIPLKSALLLGALGFLAFVILDRWTRGLTLAESVGRSLIVAFLLALFCHLHRHRQPLRQVGPVARLAATLSVFDLVATLMMDGNPHFYAEAWPALLPIYFFTYGQMVMSVTDSVIFGCSAMAAMPIAGSLVGTQPEDLISSIIILAIVNLFGLCTRCQLEIYSRNSFRERRTAQLAAEDKARFLRHVSHNLQQPLQALSCYATALDAALAERPQEETRSLVRQFGVAVDDLNDAFGRILHLSSLESGSQLPRISDVSINLLLTGLEIQFAPQAHAKGLRLRVRQRSSAPFRLRTDVNILRQVLGNLVDNAIKYTDRGGVLVAAFRSGARHLSIHVTDTGRGIPEHHRADIFAEFNRGLWRQSDAAAVGLGIGLDFVRRATERLPEHVLRFHSRPGHGTDFEVLVPLAAEPPADAGDTLGPSEPLAGRYILVFDRESGGRQAVAEQCRTWGGVVDQAGSPEELRRLMPDMLRLPDVVIADLFSDISAARVDVAAVVVAELGPVPFLVYSAGILTPEQREALPRGSVLLRKPAGATVLLDRITTAIGRKAVESP